MASNREEKNSIADEILEDISTLKRKFLKQHQGAGYWTELDKKTAKEKVMMAFREFRKSQRNQQQQHLRKARSQPQLQQSAQHQLQRVRPSLPLSQSLPHSPVTQPSGQKRRIRVMSPPIPLPGSQKHSHGRDAAQLHQGQQMELQPHGGIHYQLYPPPPPTSSIAGPPVEGYQHPTHNMHGLPQHSVPTHYAPHHLFPPYGHPMPPHLFPPSHHRPYPPGSTHDDQANSNSRNIAPETGMVATPIPTGYISSSASQVPPAIPLVGYPHHHANYFPPINNHPSSQAEGDGDDQRYKRYKTSSL